MAELQTPPPRIYVWWLAIVTALATVLALVIPGYAPSTRTALAAPGDPTPAAAEQGMVQIRTVVNYQNVVGFGSGVILSPDGIVLTCNHVVSGADTITAAVVGTGQSFRGQLLGFDRTDDIAIIQLMGAGGVPTAPIGDSNQVSVGEPVVALGNANSNGGPVSQEVGKVTSLSANIDAEDDVTGSSEQLTGLIGVAAPLRPGDDLTLEVDVIEARVSKSRPETGIVLFKSTARNAAGQALCEMTSPIIVGRRASAEGAR